MGEREREGSQEWPYITQHVRLKKRTFGGDRQPVLKPKRRSHVLVDVRVYQKQGVEHVPHKLAWCHERVLKSGEIQAAWASLSVSIVVTWVCDSTKFPCMQRTYCLCDNVSASVKRLNCAWHLAFKIDSAVTPCSCWPPNPSINDLMTPCTVWARIAKVRAGTEQLCVRTTCGPQGPQMNLEYMYL